MTKNDPWMLTASGKHFNLRNPNAEDIVISDICQSLSRLCRFTGHCKHFYSVADHVLNGRTHLDNELHQKYWDLHDVEETYLGDIPTPFKKMLGPEFKEIQQAVHKAICARFDLPLDFDQQVKRNDLRMLLAERGAGFDVDFEMHPWSIDEWMKETGDFIDFDNVSVLSRKMKVAQKELYDILIKY